MTDISSTSLRRPGKGPSRPPPRRDARGSRPAKAAPSALSPSEARGAPAKIATSPRVKAPAKSAEVPKKCSAPAKNAPPSIMIPPSTPPFRNVPPASGTPPCVGAPTSGMTLTEEQRQKPLQSAPSMELPVKAPPSGPPSCPPVKAPPTEPPPHPPVKAPPSEPPLRSPVKAPPTEPPLRSPVKAPPTEPSKEPPLRSLVKAPPSEAPMHPPVKAPLMKSPPSSSGQPHTENHNNGNGAPFFSETAQQPATITTAQQPAAKAVVHQATLGGKKCEIHRKKVGIGRRKMEVVPPRVEERVEAGFDSRVEPEASVKTDTETRRPDATPATAFKAAPPGVNPLAIGQNLTTRSTAASESGHSAANRADVSDGRGLSGRSDLPGGRGNMPDLSDGRNLLEGRHRSDGRGLPGRPDLSDGRDLLSARVDVSLLSDGRGLALCEAVRSNAARGGRSVDCARGGWRLAPNVRHNGVPSGGKASS
eukprot:GEMP01019521.1.p1 GENE.GEMP01019521.1~~GEMP01019521.1.p1  ORF type:complete len:477 (+),score=129.38 GEMP01019521.1:190-1620(+)